MSTAVRRILVVDDELEIRELLTMVLTEEGYLVHSAVHGEEALRLVLAPNGADLILLDMRMPVMDGWTFASHYQHDVPEPHAPIIVVTAAQDARRWADEIGAAGFLSKPFSLHDVRAAVHRFLDSVPDPRPDPDSDSDPDPEPDADFAPSAA